MNKIKYTPEKISKLNPLDVFVFGSNKKGMHIGGAARTANKKFGAKWGISEGISGQSYAIPTLDENMNKVSEEELTNSFEHFIEFADNNRHLTFFVTKIGCGIANWPINEVKKCFWRGTQRVSPDGSFKIIPTNVIIPEEFV